MESQTAREQAASLENPQELQPDESAACVLQASQPEESFQAQASQRHAYSRPVSPGPTLHERAGQRGIAACVNKVTLQSGGPRRVDVHLRFESSGVFLFFILGRCTYSPHRFYFLAGDVVQYSPPGIG